jgi:hypothetical protein
MTTMTKRAGFIAGIDLANMGEPKVDIEWRTASRVAREDREKKSLPG